MDGAFVVLLRNPADLAADRIAAFLAAHRKQPMIDARHQARRCWGFLGEGLSAPDADGLAQAAERVGLPAAVLPADGVPALPAAKPLRQGRFTPEALVHTIGTLPEEHSLPWTDLKLVAASAFMETRNTVKIVKEGPSLQEKAVKMGVTLMTGIPLGMGGSKEVKKVASSSDMVFSADLFAAGGRRFHVAPHAFNFSAMGVPLEPSVLGNFKLLLGELAKRAPGAVLNRGARGFLEGTPVASFGYDAAEDAAKECRWLLALEGIRG